jgi:hypothetical protein
MACIISTMIVSSVALTQVRASSPQQKILILYDAREQEISNAVNTIFHSLVEHRISTEVVGIESFSVLEKSLARGDLWVAIYVFQSNLRGIHILGRMTPWKDVANLVEARRDVHHIFGIGNAKLLFDYLNDSEKVYVEGSDVVDLRLTVVYTLGTVADILKGENSPERVEMGEELRKYVAQDFVENINEIFSKTVVPVSFTGEQSPMVLDDPRLTESYVEELPQSDAQGNVLQPIVKLGSSSNDDYISFREVPPKSGITGAIGWVLDTLLDVIVAQGFGGLEIHTDAAQEINDYIMRVVNDVCTEIADWFNETSGVQVVGYEFSDAISSLLPRQLFDFQSYVDSLIENAFYDVYEWFGGWMEQVLETPVQTKLRGLTPVFLFRVGTPLNVGTKCARFGIVLRIKLAPSFEVDRPFFTAFMDEAVFGDLNLTEIAEMATAFSEVQAFIDIIPLLDVDVAICAFLPTGNSWAKGLLERFTIDFFGSAHFQFAFLPIDPSGTPRAFVEVREWAFRFELDASYTISVWDFLLAGATGLLGFILDLVEELLDSTLTLTLSVIFEISRTFTAPGLPARSNLLFQIVVGATLDIRALIAFFRGTFQVGFGFEQTSGPADTHALYTSLKAYVTIFASLYFGIDLWFTSIDKDYLWSDTWDIYTDEGTEEYGRQAADLTDRDRDGLPDEFEARMNIIYGFTYLNPLLNDTDGDGLNDKLEIEIQTLPNISDTDNDSLSDGEEYLIYDTDPRIKDTERDGVEDGAEVNKYGTNPKRSDTDEDLLSDWFEINFSYNMTEAQVLGVTPTVSEVWIGGEPFENKTDPLNPDTDGDGLLDGEEGQSGFFWGNETINQNSSIGLLRNKGYTHPLDSDTDDDSYELWSSNGTITPRRLFYRDMMDGVEVHGQSVTFIDDNGNPYVEEVFTNPCIADTDNDTGPRRFLFGDGLELSLTPPSDPTDADSDNDGLIDGLEGVGPGLTGTNRGNPDTDNDGLNDLLDVQLPTNPLDPDTDGDTVTDGEEVLKYKTDPVKNDTDHDGLTDGEELFFFYSNPLVRDSDLDGLSDGEEVVRYRVDPKKWDTDEDGLNDGFEVFTARTDPREWDSDGDGLGDGEELNVYHTNPLDWDTDHDSVALPDETGNMTLPWGDGDEVTYGTDPTLGDTDADGLTDAQELYLAEGSVSFDPILLNPLSNDTDNDGLLDGEELVLVNVTTITYPFTGLTRWLRYGSCPVRNDTDSDGLLDGEELEYLCDPTDVDTDGDGLNDYAEVYVSCTNPVNNDTDGDELLDSLEVTDAAPNEAQWSMFPTLANNSDTDGDLLPDGLEIYRKTDPLDPDTDGDGIQDGHEFDTDGDGLTDGEEFYVYRTYYVPLPIRNGTWIGSPGGFNNPDSDGDGLRDGDEVKIYGSDPTKVDTDGDGVSDGEEVSMGGNPTDPLVTLAPRWDLVVMGVVIALVVGAIAGSIIIFAVLRKKKGGSEK